MSAQPPASPLADPARNAAALLRDRFIGFAFAGGHLLIQTDGNGAIGYATGARCGLVAGRVDDLVGRNLLEFCPPDEQPYLKRVLRRLAEKGKLDPCRVHLRTASGQVIAAQIGGCRLPLYPDTNFLSLVVGASLVQRLRGGRLPDLAPFVDGLEARIEASAALDRPQSLSLMLLDGLGEALATRPDDQRDLVLALEAYLLSISSDGDAAARVADDRYAVLHDEGLSAQEIRRDIDRILEERGADSLREALTLQQVGLARESALPAADAARAVAYTLQAFARAGSDSAAGDAMTAMLKDSVERVGACRRMLDARDFRMVYQPIVSMAGRRLHHMEALIRLGDGTSPAGFIEFAESVGLIGEVDLLVFRTVLDVLRCSDATNSLPDVAVNASAATLANPALLERLEALLVEGGALRRKLLVEVTETAVVKDIAALGRAIDRLRSLGLRVCLDDVGAGTTSFMSLSALKVDFVKLDGPLVRGAVRGGRERAILQSIIEIAGHLQADIIAEQIETEEQASFVRAQGVRFAQGYLFGHPGTDLAPRPAPARPAGQRRGESVSWQ